MVMTQAPQVPVETAPKPSDLDILRAFLRDELRTVVNELKPKPAVLKGESVRAFVAHSYDALSDFVIDCRGWNALHLEIYVTGTTPSATISVEGSGGGLYLPLVDPAALRSAVVSNLAIDCLVSTAFAKVRIADISGTYAAGQGYTIVATPYWAAGQSALGYSSAAYSTAQAATTIKAGAGVLHAITILGGTAGAITVWDNTAGSGTTICPAFTPAAVTVPVTIILDAVFTTGLTFTTAANTVLVFCYR